MQTIDQKRINAVRRTVAYWNRRDERMPRHVAISCAQALRKVPACVVKTETFDMLNKHLAHWNGVKPS